MALKYTLLTQLFLLAIFNNAISQSIVSDDFSASVLNTTLWELEDPQGGATVTMTGTQASISIPGGVTHDPWTGGNFATRLVQPTGDTDFEVEVKFETEFIENRTDYGLMIKESDTRYIRFDFYHLSNTTKVFAAYLDGGNSDIKVNSTVSVTAPLWLKVGRLGDTWTYSYSLDGTNWTEAVSFNQVLAVSEVGPYVGNSGSNPPAFTVLVDYFFNTASPIDPEDNETPDETPPVISNVNVVESAGGAMISWTTDEPATSRVDYGLSSTYGDNVEDLTLKIDHSVSITGLVQGTEYHYQITSADGSANGTTTSDATFTTLVDNTPPVISNIVATPSGSSAVITWTTDEPSFSRVDYGLTSSYTDFEEDAVLKTDHSILLSNLDSDTEYHYQVTSTDEAGNGSSSADLTFTTEAFTGIVSDDFSASVLNTTLWELEDPQGGATVTMTGTQASISIPGGVTHDPWTGGNFATRLVQPTGDTDFEVEVKFETEFIENRTDYGLMIKESDTRYIRFDFYHLSNTTKVFAAYLDGGNSDIKVNSTVSVTAPLWLKVGRLGDTWTYSYSLDGTNWTEAVSFNQVLAVSEVGPYVGNSGSNPPAFTVLVDYFFNTASPIDPEDNETPDETPPVISNVNVVESAGGAMISWTTDEPATSRVDYGLSSTYGDNVEDLTLKIDHSVSITGLVQGTEYHYQITSADGSANGTTTSDATFTTLVDNTPPVISNIVATPSGSSAVITWTTDEPSFSRVDYGLTSSYTDFEEDAVLKTDHSILLSNLDSDTEYHYQVTSTDEAGNGSSSADLIFTTEAFTGIVSDDFSASVLNTTLWELEDPQGGATVTMTGTQASISIPGGVTHDPWTGGNFATRLVQPTGDTDFEVEVKFETEFIENRTDYGLMIKESDTRYIRFDFYHLSNTTKVFAAYLDGGNSDIKVNSTVSVTAPLWLKVGRLGDTWTYSYSLDGMNWTEAVSFNQVLAVSEVGPYVGNSGSNPPAFTVLVDYFFNTASPIDPEDNETPDETPPVISNVNVVESAGGAMISWTTDEPATSRVDYGLSSTYGDNVEDLTLKIDHSVSITGLVQGTEYHYQITSADGSANGTTTSDATFTTLVDNTPPVISNIVATPSGSSAVITWTTDEPSFSRVDYGLTSSYTDFEEDAVLKTDHSILLSNLDSDTEYHYQVTSTDEAGNGSSSADLIFTTEAFTGIVSDDFSASVLNTTLWELEDPQGGATVTMTGTQASISIPGGVTHDPWTGGNFATRLVQPTGDTDFEVEVKFETEFIENRTDYGLMIKESDTRYIRFDFYHLSNTTKVFAAYLDGGNSDIKVNSTVSVTASLWLKVGRLGDTWTYSYSLDGMNWTEAVSFNQVLAVSEVGPYVGNSGSNPPAFTVLVDYFFNTASPIDPEDNETPDETPPVISNVNVVESAGGAMISWTTDEPATSRVDYGLSSTYGDNVEDLTLKIDHSVSITGLVQGTEYHYQITSADGSANGTTTSDATFTTLVDNTPPVISNIVATPSGSSAVITWTTDEPSFSRVDYGLTSSYTDFEEDAVLKTDHSLLLVELSQGTTYHYQITSVDGSSNSSTTTDDTFTTTIDVDGPILSVWYGSTQKIGHLGNPQDDFNLLGHVSDVSGIGSFVYTLNGSEPKNLSIGDNPDGFGDGRRLGSNGDFNVDILIQDLLIGDNTVILTATDSVGNQTSDVVTINRMSGSTTLPYSIDWSVVSDPQDVGQHVDGLWAHTSEGIRIQETGYDRLYLVGDRDWVDYEITVPITVHGIESETGPYSGAPGIGLIMRFAGHVVGGHRNFPDAQPKWGYQPFGAIGWLRGWNNTSMSKQFYRGDNDNKVNHGSINITYEDIYWVKMRAETLPDVGNEGVTEYSWKIWQDGESEPSTWDWQVVQQSEYALRNGGPALVAHHVNATFGDITITSATDPSDITPPVISNIQINPTGTSATISWDTDESAFGRVDYGLTSSYTDFIDDVDFKTDHSLQVENLSSNTSYHYQITCYDINGNQTTTVDEVFTTDFLQEVVSDDFSSDTLNTGLWELEDPQGGASVSMTGTQTSLYIPAGISHDPWTSGNFATRLVQSVDDLDFEVVLKIESELSSDQLYGIMVKESDDKYLRFDLINDGSTRIFAAFLNEGNSSVKTNNALTISSPIWLKVSRSGDLWTYSYSLDSATWNEAVNFTQSMAVTEIGPFIGSFGSYPEHTALFDYFFNTASPISPEDDKIAPVVSGPVTPQVEENQTVVGSYTNNEGAFWTLGGADSGLFSITEGDLIFLSPPDYEDPIDTDGDNVYEVIVEATDGAANVGTLNVSVTVTDVDDTAPVVSGPQTPGIEENQTAVSSYTNNESGTWSLSGLDASLFSITGGNLTFLLAPDYENPTDTDGDNIYDVVVEATDVSFNVGSLAVTVIVSDADEVAPMVSGPATPQVEENQTVVGSYTNNEGAVWTLGGADSGLFSITEGDLIFLSPPDYEDPIDTDVDNVYEVIVEATDGAANVGTLNVSIAVTDVDDTAPVVSGPQTPGIEENQTSVSSYTNNESGTWSISGVDAGLFSITGGNLTFLLAPDYENPTDTDGDNIYDVVVEATDVSFNVGSLAVTVIVSDADEVAPMVSGPATPQVEENQTVVGSYTNNEGAVWTLGGADSGLFSITEGDLIFLSPPDYEDPIDTDVDNVYEVIVEATDGAANVGTLNVSIAVTDVDDTAPVVSGPQTPGIEENQTSVSSYTNNESGTWSISGVDAGLFSITGGNLTFLLAPDYENPTDTDGDNIYDVVVEATDVSSNMGSLAVTVIVSDADEVAPMVSGPATPQMEENQIFVSSYTKNEDGTWSLSGLDSDLFSITGGDLTFLSPPDYENPTDNDLDNTYEVVIEATDGSSNIGSFTVAVNVLDIDDSAPVITGDQSIEIIESQIVVESYTSNELGTWRLSGADAELFSIVGGNLEFLIAPDFENPKDINGDNIYEFSIEVTDSEFNVGVLNVSIQVIDLDEVAPVISGLQTPHIAERQTYVGSYDCSEIVTFSLSGDDANLFSFVDGMLSMKSPPDFENPMDKNMDNIYEVTIEALDQQYNFGSLFVAVTVTDVDEKSPFISGINSLLLKENKTFVANYTANEPVSWSIVGVDFNLFTINADGELSFISPPDFEQPLDSDGNNIYEIVLVATDEAKNIGIFSIKVNIVNIDESIPLIKGPGKLLVDENETWTGGSYEVDGAGSWNISGEDGKFFVLIDGHLFFLAEPDFESPIDGNQDNIYHLIIEFTDNFSSKGVLEVEVTVSDVDDSSPVFSNLRGTFLGTSASITWETDEGARSRVDFGETTNYTEFKQDDRLIKMHHVELDGLRAGITYHYQVTCEDINGNRSYSGDLTFTTFTALGVSELVDRGIIVSSTYPNPFSEETRFSIQTNKSLDVNIQVYDVSGNRAGILFNGRLSPSSENEFTLERKNLPSGVYFIQIESENFVERIKVLLRD